MRSIIVLCALVTSSVCQVRHQALVNVDVYDVHTGKVVEDAVILIKGDKIASVGRGIAVPPGSEVFDGQGMTVYPGFIDGWTTLGLTEIPQVQATNDSSEIGRWNAHMRAGAAINPHSAHFPVARVNGITTAVVVPGGGTLPGEAEILDLHGRTVPKMRVDRPGRLRVLRLPQPPRRTYTEDEEKGWQEKLEKSWKPVEEQLVKARRYAEIAKTDGSPAGRSVPGQERLSLRATAAHIAEGHPWLVWADDREHILSVLAFAKKHDLELVIGGLKDGWKVAKQLKDCGHGLLLGSPFVRPGRDDPYDAQFANAAVLERAGVRFGFVSNSSPNVRNLPYQAAMATSFGLSRAGAFRALTIDPARALGIEATHGSVEEGKIANLVLYDGDPLDARVNPRQVFIRGQRLPLITRHTFLAEPFLPR